MSLLESDVADAVRPQEPASAVAGTFGRRLARQIAARRAEVLAGWQAAQFDPEWLQRFRVPGVEGMSPQFAESSFLSPLLNLLLAYLRTGEARYRHIYLDERLRYAPHTASPEMRVEFFRRVLQEDEAALLRVLPAGPDREAMSTLLGALHAPLLEFPTAAPVRLLALGDCLMNEVRVFLQAACRPAGIRLDFRSLYFSAQQGRGIDSSAVLRFLDEQPMDLLAFSFLSYEGIPLYPALLRDADTLTPRAIVERSRMIVGTMRAFLEEIRARTDTPFLVHNVSGLPLTGPRRRLPGIAPLSRRRQEVIRALNEGIHEMVDHLPNTLLVDEVAAVQRHGLRQAARGVVPRSVARAALFHTSRFGELLCEAYTEILRSFQQLCRTKVILVDFDNTLWKGVMADGPVEHHHREQALLRRLKESGILLVSASKNDPKNIRWGEMTLREDDFALHKISWEMKVTSIRAAAQELDLGLDSFVLLDDNPVERDLVRNQLPQVETLDSTSPASWRALEHLLQFPNTRDTDEARARTEMYRQQAQRREAMSGTLDYAGMMRSLGLKVEFRMAEARDLSRITELVQRTNQFNTTTVRHSRPALQAFLNQPTHGVYVASLSDKFGKVGLVCIAIVERIGGDRVFDSFVMSCRAMGFGLERLMLHRVMEAESPAQRYVGRFHPTARNGPASGLFPEAGFTHLDETEWIFPGDSDLPEPPDWFEVTGLSERG